MKESSEMTNLPTGESAEAKASATYICSWFREFAKARLDLAQMDQRRSIPPHLVLEFGNRGVFGLQMSRKLGGLGLGTVSSLKIEELVSSFDLSLGLMIGIHNGLGLRTIEKYGTEGLKRATLSEAAMGRRLLAFALSEPDAGSHPLSMSATATWNGNSWQLDGNKLWIGLADWSSSIIVFAKANKRGRDAGKSLAFLVPTDAAGVSVGQEALTVGVRAVIQNKVSFRNVDMSPEMLLGEAGDGLSIAFDALSYCRLGIGAMAVGAMKRSLQILNDFASHRKISTGLLSENPVTISRAAHHTCAMLAAENLVFSLGNKIDSGVDVIYEAFAACKILIPDLLWHCADDCVQVMGGRGCLETGIASRIWRDARLFRVFEGPTEALAMHLGSSALNEPSRIVRLCTDTFNSPESAHLAETDIGRTRRAIEALGTGPSMLKSKQLEQHELGLRLAWQVLLASWTAKTPFDEITTAWLRQRVLTDCRKTSTDRDWSEMQRFIAASLIDIESSIGGLDGLLPDTIC